MKPALNGQFLKNRGEVSSTRRRTFGARKQSADRLWPIGSNERGQNLRAAIALHALLIISACDISALRIYALNIRLAWLLLPLFLFVTRHRFWSRGVVTFVSVFFALHIIAAGFGSDVPRSVMYSFWILFSYVFFLQIGARLAIELGSQVWTIIRHNGRLQICGAMLAFLLHWQQRASFIYYEPSYMAIGLIPYVSAVFRGGRRTWIDGLLIMAFLYASQSAAFFLIVGVVATIWIYQSRRGLGFKVKTSLAVLGLIVGVVYVVENTNSINNEVVDTIRRTGMSWDSVQALIDRGGNRIPRLQAAWEVVKENPIFGVGPGNYMDYIQNKDFSLITNGAMWLDPEGKPPTNVILEAAVNAGIGAAGMIVAAVVILAIGARRIGSHAEKTTILSVIATTAIALQFDSNYLRGYVWVSFGICIAKIWASRAPQSGGGAPPDGRLAAGDVRVQSAFRRELA